MSEGQPGPTSGPILRSLSEFVNVLDGLGRRKGARREEVMRDSVDR
jgi:hypothetical protein